MKEYRELKKIRKLKKDYEYKIKQNKVRKKAVHIIEKLFNINLSWWLGILQQREKIGNDTKETAGDLHLKFIRLRKQTKTLKEKVNKIKK